MQMVEGKPYVRPCRSIPADGNENTEWMTSIGTLYESLTTLMLLAGAPMLARSGPGREPRFAAALLYEAP